MIASALGDYDHSAIAHALEWKAVRVETEAEVRDGLREAPASKTPMLLDIVVSGDGSWEKVASALRLCPA